MLFVYNHQISGKMSWTPFKVYHQPKRLATVLMYSNTDVVLSLSTSYSRFPDFYFLQVSSQNGNHDERSCSQFLKMTSVRCIGWCHELCFAHCQAFSLAKCQCLQQHPSCYNLFCWNNRTCLPMPLYKKDRSDIPLLVLELLWMLKHLRVVKGQFYLSRINFVSLETSLRCLAQL